MAVEAGDKFPEFTGTSQDGEQLSLSTYRGDDNLVVFFYPKALTPG